MYETNNDAPDRRLQFVVTIPVVASSTAASGLYIIRSLLRCRLREKQRKPECSR